MREQEMLESSHSEWQTRILSAQRRALCYLQEEEERRIKPKDTFDESCNLHNRMVKILSQDVKIFNSL